VGAAAALALAAVSIMGPMAFKKPEPKAVRFSVTAPPGMLLAEDPVESAISPDGRSITFCAADSAGVVRLWVRPLDALEARVLLGTEGAFLPFWSKDSRTIGFFADTKLKKVAAAGGSVEILCAASNPRGGTWNSDDVILLAPEGAGPICRIAAAGGELKPVTTLDSARHETAHRFPWFLPDGKRFLFTSLPSRSGKFDIWVGSLDSPERFLPDDCRGPTYVAPGYPVFSRGRGFAAQRLDLRQLRVVGQPISIPMWRDDAPHIGYRLMTASTRVISFLPQRLEYRAQLAGSFRKSPRHRTRCPRVAYDFRQRFARSRGSRRPCASLR
jgi:hypothetical protein